MTEQAFETIMEAVCDLCHHPYVLSQEELDAMCKNCPVECKIRAVMEEL